MKTLHSPGLDVHWQLVQIARILFETEKLYYKRQTFLRINLIIFQKIETKDFF